MCISNLLHDSGWTTDFRLSWHCLRYAQQSKSTLQHGPYKNPTILSFRRFKLTLICYSFRCIACLCRLHIFLDQSSFSSIEVCYSVLFALFIFYFISFSSSIFIAFFTIRGIYFSNIPAVSLQFSSSLWSKQSLTLSHLPRREITSAFLHLYTSSE